MPKYRVQAFKRNQARNLRRTSTDAEQALWQLLRSRQLSNVKFRRQVPIGCWIADYVAFKQKLIVEADGGQHAESPHDRVRDADLRKRGFRILRFWNNDILTNAAGVLETIATAVEAAPSPRGLRPRPSPLEREGRAARDRAAAS